MPNTNDRKYSSLLIFMWALTVVIWNGEAFLSVLSAILPGDPMHQSIFDKSLSGIIWVCTAFIMPCLPLIPLLYCIIRLLENKHLQYKMQGYQRNWLIAMLALNMLFYFMLGGFLLSQGRSPYPDIKRALAAADSTYYNTFIKDGLEQEAAEYVAGYLQGTYGEKYSFSIESMERILSQDSDGEVIVCQVMENNFKFHFYLSYNAATKQITYDNFKSKLVSEKINVRMKELIDDCIGAGLTLYVRWDGLNAYRDYPLDATADEILAGEYGKMHFQAIIFVYIEDIGVSQAKEMYLSILKNYCFVNMTPYTESQTPQMALSDVAFYIYFVNKAHYDKAWVGTTHPGEGECISLSYAAIGVGRLEYLAEDVHSQKFDVEQLYEAAEHYLNENYHEQW